jgi:hypothetical protein
MLQVPLKIFEVVDRRLGDNVAACQWCIGGLKFELGRGGHLKADKRRRVTELRRWFKMKGRTKRSRADGLKWSLI